MNVNKWFFSINATGLNGKKMDLNLRVKEKDLSTVFRVLSDNIQNTDYSGMVYIQEEEK